MLINNQVETVAKYVTNRLKSDILEGSIQAGSRITIKEISSLYGVSSMPVREAFNCLMSEGLIEIEQYKGAIVKALDKKSVCDIYDIREAMERILMKNVLENGLSSELEGKLLEINESLDFSLSIEELNSQFNVLNKSFHKILFSIGDNQYAMDIYLNMSNLLAAMKKKYLLSKERIVESVKEHLTIIEALKTKDLNAVYSVISKHIDCSKQCMIEGLSQYYNSIGKVFE